MMCHMPYNAPDTHLFQLMNIFKFEDLYKLCTSQFLFKLHTQTLLFHLSDIIKRNLHTHEQKENFIISKSNLKQLGCTCSHQL